jgi:hypothetical protein
MGLTITNYPLLGGIASVDTSYANIRDIKSTKREDGVHELSFMYYISKDGISVHIGGLQKTSETPFTQNTWEISYTHLKEYLTTEGITHADQI